MKQSQVAARGAGFAIGLFAPCAGVAIILSSASGLAAPVARSASGAKAASSARTSPSGRARAISLTRSAEAAFLRGDVARAVQLSRSATQVDATYARAYTWLGAALEKRGDVEGARRAYGRVLSLTPNGPDAAHVRERLRVLKVSASAVPPETASPIPTVTPRSALPSPANVRVIVDGVPLRQSAVAGRDGRLLVPLRETFESLGARVSFDAATQSLLAERGSLYIEMRLGLPTAVINGRRIALDEPVQVQSGQTLASLRFVAEALNARVAFDPIAGAVEVRSVQTPATPEAATDANDPASDTIIFAPPASIINLPPAASSAANPGPRVASTPRSAPETAMPAERNPNVVPATRLQLVNSLRPAGRARVRGLEYPGAHLVLGEDPDVSFNLDRAWETFEVRVAVPDSSAGEWTEFRLWYDGDPEKMAFPPMRVYRGREPILLRVRVANVSRLTLGPGYPGHPLALIEPKFTRSDRPEAR